MGRKIFIPEPISVMQFCEFGTAVYMLWWLDVDVTVAYFSATRSLQVQTERAVARFVNILSHRGQFLLICWWMRSCS